MIFLHGCTANRKFYSLTASQKNLGKSSSQTQSYHLTVSIFCWGRVRSRNEFSSNRKTYGLTVSKKNLRGVKFIQAILQPYCLSFFSDEFSANRNLITLLFRKISQRNPVHRGNLKILLFQIFLGTSPVQTGNLNYYLIARVWFSTSMLRSWRMLKQAPGRTRCHFNCYR